MDNIIDVLKNGIFLFVYTYLFYRDLKCKKVGLEIFLLYALIGIVINLINYRNMNFSHIINIVYSILFGIMIMLFSYLSKETVGFGDSLFFTINGLYLNLTENVMLFLSGLVIASVYGIYRFIRYKSISYEMYAIKIPFIPCLLPMIIWRVICLL